MAGWPNSTLGGAIAYPESGQIRAQLLPKTTLGKNLAVSAESDRVFER